MIEVPPPKKIVSLEDLSFVRIFDPIHIPTYLIEQIKGRLFTVENFYSWQKTYCLVQSTSGRLELNPSNLLYTVINDKLKQVKGFLWMSVDYMSESLFVNHFSIDKEYWKKGEALNLLEDKAKKVMKDLNLKRILWVTKTPHFAEMRGFKRSKDAIMIYEDV